MEILTERRNDVPTWLKSRFSPQQPLAVVWDSEGRNRFWCLGFFRKFSRRENYLC